MISRPGRLPYPAALQRMFRGSQLLRTNGKRGEYEISPGGPISDDTARRILEHTLCRPVDPGLLTDQPQSWQFETAVE